MAAEQREAEQREAEQGEDEQRDAEQSFPVLDELPPCKCQPPRDMIQALDWKGVFFCDVCNCDVGPGFKMHLCKHCDFAVCFMCYGVGQKLDWGPSSCI